MNRLNSEAVDSTEGASEDYDIRQYERVLEYQNKDFWLRPTDLLWHYPIRVTIGEIPSKNYRERFAGKTKARETKIERYKNSPSWSWQSYYSW